MGDPMQTERIVHRARICLVCVLSTAVLFPSWYQPFLTALWAYLKHSSIYRASSFETFWTVFCYAAIEVPMTVTFLNHPEWRLRQTPTDGEPSGGGVEATKRPRKAKGMRRPSRRWREAATYILPLLALDLLMIKKFADVSLEQMLRSGNYDGDAAAAAAALPASRFSTAAHPHFLAPTLHNFTWDSPLQTRRALPDVAPTSRRVAVELVASFVLYDALFFLFHFAMHVAPVLKGWHQPHHSHDEIHPQVTNQLHPAERLGLVLLANFALNIIKSHCLTRTLFVPVFVWLLVEIHSGLDLPWGYEKILPRGWGGGARKHAAHHQAGIGGFAPFFEWCDGLVKPFIRT